MNQLDAAITKLERQVYIRAERRDFARMILKLSEVTDDRERARILDDKGLLSEESRRHFLTENDTAAA